MRAQRGLVPPLAPQPAGFDRVNLQASTLRATETSRFSTHPDAANGAAGSVARTSAPAELHEGGLEGGVVSDEDQDVPGLY